MNILILQGPNLNLLGLRSLMNNNNLTLDKLNKAIKVHFQNKDVQFKILQTHKEFQALNFLQRNRKWASGILLIPTSWARNQYAILETINLINIPTAAIYFEDGFSFGTLDKNSILIGDNIKSFSGSPIEVCIQGLEYLIK